MSPSNAFYKAAGALCIFFVLVFAVAFIANPYYPLQVLAGESSVGTWVSGVLLIVSATVSLTIGIRTGHRHWFLIAAFFSTLALDERFMFHERLKEKIIFSLDHSAKHARWLYELPAITGACIGAVIAYILWKKLQNTARRLLLAATILGTASVTIDVLAAGVVWEESCKLLAELIIACALLRQADHQNHAT